MARDINCLICKKRIGVVIEGTKLLPGVVHICADDAKRLKQQAEADAMRKAAKDFGGLSGRGRSGDFIDELLKAFKS